MNNSEGATRFELLDGCFLFAQSTKTARAWAIQISGTNCLDRLVLERCIENCTKELQEPSQHLKWKVIARADISEKLFNLLLQMNLDLEKKLTKTEATEIWFWSNPGKLLASKSTKKARVLIVDDSKTIRTLLTNLLSDDPDIEVVAVAELPSQVEALIKKHQPNVVTLDIHMPEMDGVTLLKKLRPYYPIPYIMISSLTPEEGPEIMDALESGAFDYIKKPELNSINESAQMIRDKVKAAVYANVAQFSTNQVKKKPVKQIGNYDLDSSKIIAFGSSTGGTEALREVLTKLPNNIPPILITQHIPAVFSAAFAKRMNELCQFEVREAQDGDLLKTGLALIAPGGFQMALDKKPDGSFCVKITDGPLKNRHKPSVDILFDSVAELYGSNSVGIILTGMGADGAKGMLKMKKSGSRTIAQDEKSCVVFGMPRQAIELGAAEEILNLEQIPDVLLTLVSKNVRRKVSG